MMIRCPAVSRTLPTTQTSENVDVFNSNSKNTGI